jgi:hypothetical protein
MVRQLPRRSFSRDPATLISVIGPQVDHLLAAADYTYQPTPSDL